MEENKNGSEDWELSDGYYNSGDKTKKELKLDDFIIPDEQSEDGLKSGESQELKKTIEDVKKVRELAALGRNVKQIAAETGLEETYIFNIQVCSQGFREDDETAVAHLVMMG